MGAQPMAEQSTLQDDRRTYRFWVDDALFDTFGPRLGPYGIAVYTYLARRVSDGSTYPSLTRIARDTGMSRDSVIRSMKVLEDFGLITKEVRTTTEGNHTSNLYHLCDLSPYHGLYHGTQNHGSSSQLPPSLPQRLPLVDMSDHPSSSQQLKGFSEKDTQVEGKHTPPTPSEPPKKVATPPVCVSSQAKISLDFFPITEEGQGALRALVMTPDLDNWAATHHIHLDLAAEFEHWLNDGLSNGRKKRDFVSAFKCWLQSPLRVQSAPSGLSKFEQKKAIVEAAGRRFVEEIRRERDAETPVHDHAQNGSLRVPRSAGRPATGSVLARTFASLHPGAI
jgi:Helix-turn-helix domain